MTDFTHAQDNDFPLTANHRRAVAICRAIRAAQTREVDIKMTTEKDVRNLTVDLEALSPTARAEVLANVEQHRKARKFRVSHDRVDLDTQMVRSHEAKAVVSDGVPAARGTIDEPQWVRSKTDAAPTADGVRASEFDVETIVVQPNGARHTVLETKVGGDR